MNKARRSELSQAREAFEKGNYEEAKMIAESVCNGEQEAYDNMPEALQAGERGETMQGVINSLEAFSDKLQELIDAAVEAEELLSAAEQS